MLTVEKDGGVEGCAFTSCEKSELVAEQPSKGGPWNPPKKDAPCPRTKGRRSAITFKIKPPTCQTLGGHKESVVCTRTRERSGDCNKRLGQTCESPRVSCGGRQGNWWRQPWEEACVGPKSSWRKALGRSTNRRSIIPKTFSHCCASPRPHNRLPNLGVWQKEWESPGNLALQFSWIWSHNFYRPGNKRLLEGTDKTACTRESRRKEPWPRKRLRQTYLCVWEALEQVWVSDGLLRGWGTGSCGPGRRGVPAKFSWRRSPSPLDGAHSLPQTASSRTGLPQAKLQGARPITENQIKDLPAQPRRQSKTQVSWLLWRAGPGSGNVRFHSPHYILLPHILGLPSQFLNFYFR